MFWESSYCCAKANANGLCELLMELFRDLRNRYERKWKVKLYACVKLLV